MTGRTSIRMLAWAALAAAAWAPVIATAQDDAAIDQRIAAELAEVAARLDPRAQEALAGIDGLGRRLLAARAYLRAGDSLAERWSWSQDEIDRYPGSPLQRALDAEIGTVRARFEADNPGYTLWVNPAVRSLELQLQNWNANASVADAAASLLDQVRAAAPAPTATSAAGNESRWLDQALRAAVPDPAPALAAPGLSLHGRMQAVDFHIRQGEQTVAGPDTSTIAQVWQAQGWCERLVRAVHSASDRFDGPLIKPNEPWHFDYRTGPETGGSFREAAESKGTRGRTQGTLTCAPPSLADLR